MLAAEALDGDAVRDRAARRQGQVVLAGLSALQRVLLEGGDLGLALERLEGLIADMPEADRAAGWRRCWGRSCCACGLSWRNSVVDQTEG